MVVIIAFRAESEFAPTASTTSVSPTSTSSASPSELDPDSTTQMLTKDVLEWLFLALVVLVMGSIIYRRLYALKRNRLPITAFFSAHNPRRNAGTISRPTRPFPSAFGSSLSAYDLTNVPTAYNPFSSMYTSTLTGHRIQTQAADIDSGGRRVGSQSDYHNEFADQKDMLPAYDKSGSPPGYIDSLPAMPSQAPGSVGEQREGHPHSEDPRSSPGGGL
ncbi:hypothetical protein J3R30DRAFT_1797901 [Lentinula aciculospora]|uniref:Uncharacterized protein n=1 Tax=Lentinula aciculospora TaxID=153920 RepID=A0A9W9AK09_9AGAR|nr:hypothetical protein J3R30DRAFT_1797901 [Lentinula aciculospora]